MFMVDLAVPHDIEKEVGELSDVYLYSVDDLKNVIDEGLQNRREAAEQAEDIINTQVSSFQTWVRSQGASEIIQQLRHQSEQSRDTALNKALQSLQNGTNPENVLKRLANDLTNKLLHEPSSSIKQASADSNIQLLQAAKQLFKLKK